jgi:phage-related protein
MKEILFYRTRYGRCPIEEFLDDLSEKQARKVTWVLRLIRDVDKVPSEYLKKLANTDDIWEIRIHSEGLSIRLLGIYYNNNFILTNGFVKKSQKTPSSQIKLAEDRKKDFFSRSK